MTLTFDELYDAYQPHVLRFTAHLLGDQDWAEDITQETFLRAWCAMERLYPESNLRAWLFRIARNLVIDFTRHKQPVTAPLEDYYDLAASEDVQEVVTNREHISGILSRLPEKYQEVLLLSYGEGIAERVIAEQLGVSRDTVRMRLVRGRSHFKTWYQATEEVA